MGSRQTLSEADRRLVAAWAADCAERALVLFEAAAPGDDRPRMLIARTRAYADGALGTADEIRRRFAGGVGADEVTDPAAAAAARAAGLAAPDRPDAVHDEIRWQLDAMSPEVRAALRTLPPVGEDRSGPLGPGLLASGALGEIIREFQAGLRSTSST